MKWNEHSHLEGAHSFLSPSSYHWVNYSIEKLENRWKTMKAALKGVEDHRYAAVAIEERLVQDDETTTLGLYINQCIQHRMKPEVVLFYSPNCFGTADAIAFRYGRLKIADLKTGATPTSEKQLEIYAALFCLEYGFSPYDLRSIELFIYQDGECRPYVADPAFIQYIMDTIVAFDLKINELREEVSQ